MVILEKYVTININIDILIDDPNKKKSYVIDVLGKLLITDEDIDLTVRIRNMLNNMQNTNPIKINDKKQYFTFELKDYHKLSTAKHDIILKHCCNIKNVDIINKSLDEILKDFNSKVHSIDTITQYDIPESYLVLVDLENKLPRGLSVATITLIFKTDAKFNLQNIGKHITIDKFNHIENVTYKINGVSYFRTQNPSNKKKKNAFYNQVSLKVKINSKNKSMNIKLFYENSVHLTGCKKISDIIEVIEKLNHFFSEKKYVHKDGKFELVEFIDDTTKFNPVTIYDIKICMINTNFNIGYKINRNKVYDILYDKGTSHIDIDNKKKILLSFEKNIRPSIDIKYPILERTDPKSNFVSIFIFGTGAVLITGAKTVYELYQAYAFIIKLTTKYYRQIVNLELEF